MVMSHTSFCSASPPKTAIPFSGKPCLQGLDPDGLSPQPSHARRDGDGRKKWEDMALLDLNQKMKSAL
jgi:hypothetical protein